MAAEGMKLCTYQSEGEPRLGGVLDDRVYDLNRAYTVFLARAAGSADPVRTADMDVPPDMTGFIRRGKSALEKARQAVDYVFQNGLAEGFGGTPITFALKDSKILTPIPRPESIICMGCVYKSHVLAWNMKIPDEPHYFAKTLNCLIGPDDHVVIPRAYPDDIVYGTELALVIGKPGKNIPEDKVYDHIYGYTILNDITARGLTMPQCKIIDTFSPVGPWITLCDRVKNPRDLVLKCRVNGTETQNGNTSEMMFDIPEQVSLVSRYTALKVGDIIATGDVGVSDPLKPGDIMEAEIQDIGVLRNPVRLEE